MDVAAVKKNYVDAGTGAKANAGSPKGLGDFSAAVAERLKQGGHVSISNGKNSLVSALGAKPDIRPEVRPQKEAYDTSTPTDRGANEPRERNKTVEARNDAPVQDNSPQPDAPREAQQDTAPTDRGDNSSHKNSDDGQSSSDHSSDTNGSKEQAAKSTENSDPNGAATPDGQVAVVQQVNTGAIAQVLTQGATKAEKGTIATTDTSGTKQKALAGGTKQNALAGQANTENAPEVIDLAQKDGKSNSKAASAQTQNAANTHVQAGVRDAAEKGPSLAQQQAADLAKKIGPNQNLNVSVNVSKPSDELVSKPSASLAGPANIKAEGAGLTPTSVQAAVKGPAQQVLAQNTGGQNGANAQGQNQQLAQFQTAQAEAAKLAANTADAKTAQSSSANSGAQVAKVGGAEGAATPQGTAPTAVAPQTQQTQQTVAKPPVTPQTQTNSTPTEQVKVQIAKAISDGVDTIRIQLKPAHLGRIDVQLDMGQDGRVTAVISADNKETMDMLKQDSRELERALRDAGLNLSSGDLSFNMRGENGSNSGTNETAQGKSALSNPVLEPTLNELLEMQSGQPQIISDNRVDITA